MLKLKNSNRHLIALIPTHLKYKHLLYSFFSFYFRNSILSEWNDFQTQSNEISVILADSINKVKSLIII